MTKKRKGLLKANIVFLFISLFIYNNSYSQEINGISNMAGAMPIKVSAVKLDGNDLFNVRGVSSFPSEQRAKEVSDRIKIIASNPSITPDSLKIVAEDNHFAIYAEGILIIRIYDGDGAVEGIPHDLLAQTIQVKIITAIETYRKARSRPELMKHFKLALLATGLLTAILFGLLWLIRRIDIGLQNRIKKRIESVENISFNLIKSNQIWRIFHALIRILRTIVILLTIIFFIDYVLSLFPWTNPISKYTLKLILDPIKAIGTSFLNYIPKFIFLLFIYFLTKYVLKLIKLFFIGIEEGNIVLNDFSPEWSMSTFKIVKFAIVAFSIVVSYPYIPGSDSIAFKGVSVFVGVMFSLGSSSFIGNLIAGYTMIYRGAFKKGDLIEVDNQIAFVEEQRLMVTRLRSFKNEEIVIPNSVLVNSRIINYTVKAEGLSLIIHTTVGIGYETPWRQVVAMLKLAAKRTEGILKNPPPFVLKKSLADFAINYEINGYYKDVKNINAIYTALNQNILDVFNENNVQIMTPSYRADPDIPKVVPRDQWHTPLARED
jgi:small-conductance mechanosensitive channel